MSNKKVCLTKDALASLSKFDSLSEGHQQPQTGKWKTITTVIANDWVSSAASGYIVP